MHEPLKKDVASKWSVGLGEICGRRQKSFLTLWFKVRTRIEKSCLWRLVDVACADCLQLKPEREGIISAASFHGLTVIHTCLPCPSSRWVVPCVPYRLLLAFVFGDSEQVSMVLVSPELMLFLFIYYFIVLLLFIYLFLVKGLFTIKYKYYTIFK